MKKLITKIIGNKSDFTIQHRIFNASLFIGILLGLQGIIINLLLDFHCATILISFLGIILFTSFYLYSIIKVKLILPAMITFSFMVLLFIPVMWLKSSGTGGAFHSYIFLFTIIIIVVLKGRYRQVMFLLLLFTTIALIIFEYNYPEYITQYPNKFDRLLDFLINAPIVIFAIALLFFVYINQYISVNNELISFNDLLEIQNAEIIKQRQLITNQKNEISTKVKMLELVNKELNNQNKEYKETLKSLKNVLTKLQETQEMLIESEKMAALGNLVAGVAHEMNTPVGIGVQATSGILDRTKKFADLLKKKEIDNKLLVEYLNYVYESSKLAFSSLKRSGNLIKSFKLVSVNQSTEELKKFNLKSYFSDILFSLQSKFKTKNIKIKIDCDENLEIESFPGVFAQITTNLIINTIKHGFKNENEGQILIHAEKINNTLQITYKDNGKGMSKEVLKKLFDPFFTTNKKEGTGLGMHIIYNLVTQKLDGYISCESEINKGVTFNITIPLDKKKS